MSWLTVPVAAAIVCAMLWFAHARVEVLGLVGSGAVVAVAVVLHHVVVTRDAGEYHDPRPDTTHTDLPATLRRRHVLGGGAAVVGVGLGALVGLRILGPRPRASSAWERGSALVTIQGDRLRAEDVPVGGVVTVWPEDAAGTERAAVMLIHLRDPARPPTDLSGVIDGSWSPTRVCVPTRAARSPCAETSIRPCSARATRPRSTPDGEPSPPTAPHRSRCPNCRWRWPTRAI